MIGSAFYFAVTSALRGFDMKDFLLFLSFFSVACSGNMHDNVGL